MKCKNDTASRCCYQLYTFSTSFKKTGRNAREMSTFLMIFWQTPQGVHKAMRKEEIMNIKNYC